MVENNNESNKIQNVLIVDDEDMIRQVLHAVMVEVGITVQGEARSGEEALSELSRKAVDLVLLDINMPGEDGLVVLKKIHEKYPKTKVIMISGEATMRRVEEAMKEGAIDFIAKPFSPHSVVDKMNKLVS